RREQAGLKKEDVEVFQRISSRAEGLLKGGQYDSTARQALIAEAAGVLAPYFLPMDMTQRLSAEQKNDFKMILACLQQFYSQNSSEILDGYRRFVAQVLEFRPGLFRGMPDFRHELY